LVGAGAGAGVGAGVGAAAGVGAGAGAGVGAGSGFFSGVAGVSAGFFSGCYFCGDDGAGVGSAGFLKLLPRAWAIRSCSVRTSYFIYPAAW